MVRPFKKSKDKTINIPFAPTPDLLNILDAACGQQSRFAYIRWRLFGERQTEERRQ
jgi:hypothetical protein